MGIITAYARNPYVDQVYHLAAGITTKAQRCFASVAPFGSPQRFVITVGAKLGGSLGVVYAGYRLIFPSAYNYMHYVGHLLEDSVNPSKSNGLHSPNMEVIAGISVSASVLSSGFIVGLLMEKCYKCWKKSLPSQAPLLDHAPKNKIQKVFDKMIPHASVRHFAVDVGSKAVGVALVEYCVAAPLGNYGLTKLGISSYQWVDCLLGSTVLLAGAGLAYISSLSCQSYYDSWKDAQTKKLVKQTAIDAKISTRDK